MTLKGHEASEYLIEFLETKKTQYKTRNKYSYRSNTCFKIISQGG